MTAPDLVEVVQAALAAHQRLTLALYPDYYCCTCGERSIEQPSAHQARAVLDALTEAGTVEWGVQTKTFIDGDWDSLWNTDRLRMPLTEDTAKNHPWLKSPRPFRVVSRLRFPWKVVE